MTSLSHRPLDLVYYIEAHASAQHWTWWVTEDSGDNSFLPITIRGLTSGIDDDDYDDDGGGGGGDDDDDDDDDHGDDDDDDDDDDNDEHDHAVDHDDDHHDDHNHACKHACMSVFCIYVCAQSLYAYIY